MMPENYQLGGIPPNKIAAHFVACNALASAFLLAMASFPLVAYQKHGFPNKLDLSVLPSLFGSSGSAPNPVTILLSIALFELFLVGPVMAKILMSAVKASTNPSQILGKHLLSIIVPFAFFESAAILGLVIGLTYGFPEITVLCSALAILMMALHWPSRERLEAIIRKL